MGEEIDRIAKSIIEKREEKEIKEKIEALYYNAINKLEEKALAGLLLQTRICVKRDYSWHLEEIIDPDIHYEITEVNSNGDYSDMVDFELSIPEKTLEDAIRKLEK